MIPISASFSDELPWLIYTRSILERNCRLTLDGIRLVPPLRRQEHPLSLKIETTLGSPLPSFCNLSLSLSLSLHPRYKRTGPNIHDAGPLPILCALPGHTHQGASAETMEVGTGLGCLRCRGLCDPAQVWRPFWALLDPAS